MSTDSTKATILVVDDDDAVLEALEEFFVDDFTVIAAATAQEAIDSATSHPEIGAIVMDIKMAEMDGIVAARHIRQILPEVPVIFHTGYPGEYDEKHIDRTEEPFDFIRKGKSLPQLMRSVRNAVESYNLKQDTRALSELMQRDFGIVGRSKAMQTVFQAIRQVGDSKSSVMIQGETGTGKELVARALHRLSGRSPLAVLNCNHKEPAHIESELFGHTKSAFSSVEARTGKVEYADGGTLFLDEIGDLDITTQAKLLRVVEYGQYEKLGDPELRTVDIRSICATHRNLEQLVSNGAFREDLYYRLRGVTIELPPLRDRKEDIPLLASTFVQQWVNDRDTWPRYLDDAAIDVLLEHDWPGNVRDLSLTVQGVLDSTTSEVIFADDIRDMIRLRQSQDGGDGLRLADHLRQYERTLILQALNRTGYNVQAAAKILDVDRSNLHKKLETMGIDAAAFRTKG